MIRKKLISIAKKELNRNPHQSIGDVYINSVKMLDNDVEPPTSLSLSSTLCRAKERSIPPNSNSRTAIIIKEQFTRTLKQEKLFFQFDIRSSTDDQYRMLIFYSSTFLRLASQSNLLIMDGFFTLVQSCSHKFISFILKLVNSFFRVLKIKNFYYLNFKND